MNEVIHVEKLSKFYNAVKAIDGIDLVVLEGEIFGMVGPNGAGKTTTIECIEGLRTPDDGTINVLGMDPQKQRSSLYQMIGMQLQGSSLNPKIKVEEAMDLFSSFYSNHYPTSKLLELLGLMDKRTTYFSKLSGGQKQRLFICLALVNNPRLVFFDELTTGLDPQARRATWDLIRGIRNRGQTVFITTHFMEEAEALCDRVAIMDHGKIIALGTPHSLVEQYANETCIQLPHPSEDNMKWLWEVPGVTSVEVRDSHIFIKCSNDATGKVLQLIDERGIPLGGLQIQQSNLEDVFLSLTGKDMRD